MMGRVMDRFIHTDDDVSLRYTARGGRPPGRVRARLAGRGRAMAPAAEAPAGRCRAITYDQRGHGRSHDAPSGWTVHRLAYDLAQLLEHLALTDTILVGHSMGCSVIWAHLELVGAARLADLVLVDQSPAMVVDPVWDERTIGRAGVIFTDRELHAVCHSLADPESHEQAVRAIVAGMLTPAASSALRERVVACGLRVDGTFAASLLRNHAHQDWRRQIGLINLPTQVVAGRASVVPWTAAEWIPRRIPGARLEICERDEGGSHLLALENPAKRNRLLSEFLAAASSSDDLRLSCWDPTPSNEPEGVTTWTP
jgi:pimeloyl-ACP methyl ester carboxylesterase